MFAISWQNGGRRAGHGAPNKRAGWIPFGPRYIPAPKLTIINFYTKYKCDGMRSEGGIGKDEAASVKCVDCALHSVHAGLCSHARSDACPIVALLVVSEW